MAKRGYTLQKSRTKCNFRNLEADVAAADERRMAAMANIINGVPN
jgi:hypothetical protein